MKKLPRILRLEFRLSNDGDAWGRVMAWRFALCDYLLFHHGIYTLGFRPALMGPNSGDDSYCFLRRARYAVSTLLRFQACLERLARILEAQGKDY